MDLQIQKLKEEIEQQKQIILRSEKMRTLGFMVSSVAHEVNNQIAVIVSIVQQLLEDKDLDENIKEPLNVVLNSSMICQQSVEPILCFSKDRATQKVAIDEILDDVIKLVKKKCEKCNIQIIKEITKSPLILGVAAELESAFLNIVINAIDVLPDGGKISIKNFIDPERKYICVAVKDTGPGIEEQNKDRVFEPFFTTKEKGTGLGLTITKQIIEKHGGEIKLSSDRGLTVAVSFPI
ncbi:MAG TPA: ATP-binding protein [bacterium]|nr:ATP-binding protein [bacterium]